MPLFRKARAAGQQMTFVGAATDDGPTMVDGVLFPLRYLGGPGQRIADMPNACS